MTATEQELNNYYDSLCHDCNTTINFDQEHYFMGYDKNNKSDFFLCQCCSDGLNICSTCAGVIDCNFRGIYPDGFVFDYDYYSNILILSCSDCVSNEQLLYSAGVYDDDEDEESEEEDDEDNEEEDEEESEEDIEESDDEEDNEENLEYEPFNKDKCNNCFSYLTYNNYNIFRDDNNYSTKSRVENGVYYFCDECCIDINQCDICSCVVDCKRRGIYTDGFSYYSGDLIVCSRCAPANNILFQSFNI